MNINIINKALDKLSKLEDRINYEYEPKAEKKIGKRNIFYDDIKTDFINEVNTYGFSPFIFKNYLEQREDPNIMKFMNKNFNHGLTNYIKLETKNVPKLSAKKNNRKTIKKNTCFSNVYLMKKNEASKKDEILGNFLKKALLKLFL